MVAAARAEAERISSDAQKKRQDLIGRTDDGSAGRGGRMVAAASQEAERRKRNVSLTWRQKSKLKSDSMTATRQGAVAAAVRCVCWLA